MTRGVLVVRLLGGRFSGRIHLRSLAVCTSLTVMAVALVCYALSSGSITIPVPDVVSALLGNAADRIEMVVMQWRLPRIGAAVVFGAALGASGAIFQSVTRNPLGSPDVIGFDSGAITGALIAILMFGMGPLGVSTAAIMGGLGTAACVLAIGRSASGTRLIVAGIALTVTLVAFNQLLIMRADLFDSLRATHWTLGDVDAVGWSRLLPATAAIALALVAVACLSRPARHLEVHGAESVAFGIRPGRIRVALVVVATALVAIPTSIAGPITFVALVSPHLARQLTRRSGLSVGSAACTGAFLLLTADIAIQRLPIDATLPVGVATLVLGGGYFIFLLVQQVRNV
jgi:iron complex transport system permease protein